METARLFTKAEKRESLEILNYQIKCMLPGNRKPEVSEISACGLFLEDEIAIIQPEVIVPLGQYATKAVLKCTQAHSKPYGYEERIVFGRLLEVHGQKIFPLSHPASLLYNPSYEADTIKNYQKLRTFL